MSWIGPRSVDGGLDEFVVGGKPTGIWLCGKHLTGPDPEAARARVPDPEVAIVCLCQRHELEDRYPEYVAWLEANAGRRAHWFPIPDLSAPPIDQARTIVAAMSAALDAGRSLIVHCGAGIGRAPTMSIATLLSRGYQLETLLEAVGEARPMAGPETGDQQELLAELAGP